MNATTNINQQKPGRYRCLSIENNWPHRHARYADVYVQWFVNERPLDYAEQFAGFCDLNDPYSRGVIEESFTADEALRFAAYAKKTYGFEVTIEPIQLPVPGRIVGVSAATVGGPIDFHMLSKEEGYSLPFEVWGYYDVREARVIESATSADREVILRPNNCATHESCALCNSYDRADAPLMAALDGSERWVCLACFEKRSRIPGSAQLIDYLNGVLYEPARTPDERREAFLCNLDIALASRAKPVERSGPIAPSIFTDDLPF